MAASERPSADTSVASPTLFEQLASVLPKDVKFKIHHLSTPPTRSSAIYSAPPGQRPDRTYCETHFLTASINAPCDTNAADTVDVLVYAVEIMIYFTAHSTTFFVSKADSTGYLHLLGLPKGAPSPIRDITATFLRHLVHTHERKNIRSVISLFARAQDQYLFPGSVEYRGKHVLDDRGLVRWWCRVLDPLIDESRDFVQPSSSPWNVVKGYLVVPGLDSHETLSYVPKKSGSNRPWTVGHPLKEIAGYAGEVPPRCLIPHFPDDPKARFLDELDEEITEGRDNASAQWRSVKTIDQFWDMMAYRQECSAGRLVGFIWIVFEPKEQNQPTKSTLTDPQQNILNSQPDSPGRLDSGDPNNLKAVNLTNQLTSSMGEEEKSRVRVGFQDRMDHGQYMSLVQKGIDPCYFYYRQQAVSRVRNESEQEDKQLGQLQNLHTPAASFEASSQIQPTSSPIEHDKAGTLPVSPQSNQKSKTGKPKKKKLTGPIIPRQPRIKTANKNYLLERPESTAYYIWRPEGRGQIVIDESDYKRIHELLLRLDFANLELATSSSRRWINEVRSGACGDMHNSWGQTVTGAKVVEIKKTLAAGADVNSLNMGLVRKKRKAGPEEPLVPSSPQSGETKVNTLSGGMIRKKVKV